MKKNILTLIIINITILSLIGTTAIAAFTPEITSEPSIDQIIPESPSEKIGTIQIDTTGPVWQTIKFADVTFIDGPTIKITLIARLLSSRNLYLMLPKLPININDLTFSVKYRFNTPNIPLLKRFTYETRINENGNVTTYNEKHTIIVSGFDGQFILYRAKPIRLTPATFEFTGTCDDVIVS
jgi:hypothetical protein